jgi:SAM-dependent methyltransferase
VTHEPETKQPDPYEAILYPGFPFAQTHPDRLFMIAVLYGLDPAPPEGCRVLEIGCGDGMNLAAMAAGTPGLHGIGIDRAAAPLERGRRYAEALTLPIEFRALDLLDAADADLGDFDYVIAHGVYAWVPPPVQEALLALTARVLRPDGIAFVSYNALPGGHVRRAMRDLLRYHAAGAETPEQAAERAREIARFAGRWQDRTDPYGLALNMELKRIRTLSDHSLIHDDLGDVWDPLSLADFVGRAAAHGLRYVADAERDELKLDRYPTGVEDGIREMVGDDLVAREQYGDLISGRAFRQTLLCRAERTPSPDPQPAGLARLHLSSEHSPDPFADGSYASDIDAACALLAARHPRTARLDELAESAGADPEPLAAALLTAFRRGLVEARTRTARAADTVPERPLAPRLTRLMAVEGGTLATIDHEVFETEDLFFLRLLTLCDGRRDRDELIEKMLESVGSELTVEVDGVALEAAGEDLRDPFTARVDELLDMFVEIGLIVAPE